ncbi:MAG: flavodoxin [Candidatus Marinimicrobia bacterium]|nr:flavodoxin [Candidatus Neomarinimicrobiota bacterium]
MKILIIYATTHGTTAKAVDLLTRHLENHEVRSVNIKKETPPDPENVDVIIVGGSIHAGRIQGRIKKYLAQYQSVILQKKLGLFICCMEKDHKARDEFEAVYPETLKKHAIAHGCFGGEFLMDKMNFLQRVIIKKISGVDKTVSQIDFEAIQNFAERIKKDI